MLFYDTLFYRTKNKKICQRIWTFAVCTKSIYVILGNKIADKIMKQKLAMDENSGNVKEIVIPPEKMQEMFTLGIIILNSASRR